MLAMGPYAISGILRHAALKEIFSLIERGLTDWQQPAVGGKGTYTDGLDKVGSAPTQRTVQTLASSARAV
jgi:hypothetical protein